MSEHELVMNHPRHFSNAQSTEFALFKDLPGLVLDREDTSLCSDCHHRACHVASSHPPRLIAAGFSNLKAKDRVQHSELDTACTRTYCKSLKLMHVSRHSHLFCPLPLRRQMIGEVLGRI